jgi:transcriptional regulator with XRE-family HTH domain
MNIPRSIKLALVYRDMRGQDLAKKLGVSPAYISGIVTGNKLPSLDRLQTISKELNYELSEFIALGE